MDSIFNSIKTIGKSFFNRLFERSIRVYIQKHLGEFLLGKLTTDQVDLGLDGGTLDSLYLNAENINERLESANLPFTLVNGYIDYLKLHIPWTKISTDSILVEVDGLMLTIKMKEEELDDVVDMKSIVESMTASMVEEVMKSEVATADAEKIAEAGKGSSPFESVELMSELISSITSRIQIVLKDVLVRTEKLPGVCLELHIKELDYFDKDSTTTKDRKPNVPPTPEGFSTKVVEILDVQVSLQEMQESQDSFPQPMDPQEQSLMAFDIAMSSPPSSGNFMQSSSMIQSIYPGSDPFSTDSPGKEEERESIPILAINKTQTVSIQIKNNEMLPGPTVNVTWNMESIHAFMSPKLLQLASVFLTSEEKHRPANQMPMTSEDFEMCKNAYEEENRDSFGDGPNVPPLTMAKHMEMMHGGTSDSVLSDEDLFYSTHPTFHKMSTTSFDVSDSASVSTCVNSTFSSPQGNLQQHTKRHRDSSSRRLSDNAVETQNVNITIPFFNVTLLLEDPDQQPPVIPSKSSSFMSPKPKHHSSPAAPNRQPGCKTSDTNEESQCFKSAIYYQESDEDEEEDDDEQFFNCDGDHQKEKTSFKKDSTGSGPARDYSKSRVAPEPSKNSGANGDNILLDVAQNFFKQIALIDCRIPFHELKDKLSHIVPYDHLGLFAKPVQINIQQEKKASESGFKAKATFGKLEVIECLFGSMPPRSDFCKTSLPKLPQYSVLLTFDGNGVSEAASAMHEAFDMFDTSKSRVSQSALTLLFESPMSKKHRKEPSPLVVSLEFGKLTSEVDLTIIDRLAVLFTASGNGSTQNTHLVDVRYGQLEEAMIDENTSSQVNVDINVKVTHATLRVRFPIPDLRVDRVPSPKDNWCRRNLHKEILVLELEAPEALTKIKPDPLWQLEVQIFKISAYLQEDINKSPILFGEVTVDDTKASPRDVHHLDWPRLVIVKNNKAESELEVEADSDASGSSMEYCEDLMQPESSPFSHKKTMYERDDLSHANQESPDNDEMVMPGDASELNLFREKCRNHTGLLVDISVPSITAFLHDKDFLELLYNRFNNDLLMWEPAPVRTGSNINNFVPSNTNLGVLAMLQQHGRLTDSTLGGESDSDDDDPDESMQYSIHDKHKSHASNKQATVKPVSKTCFSLDIGKGKVLAVIRHANAEEMSSKEPYLHGEMMLTLNRGLLFSVNQYAGDPDLKYLCFHANRVHMYHNAHVTTPVTCGTLDHIRNKIPDHLSSRIYRSDRGASEMSHGRAGWGEDSPHMLSLVVKTKVDTINNIKNFIVAVGINGATLRHEMHQSGESWISQAMDLLDLKDFPIQGYTLPKIMTELHLQLHHCCVDFRPLHLPIKSFLTVERFSVCTNIISESALSQIRLLLDKSSLYLSQTNRCNRDLNHGQVNLFEDYVCVAEMDQLKIWLQFCYAKSNKQKAPKSDLRFMCNRIDIQTCADSCKAFFDLIEYFINDGDLIVDMEDDSSLTDSDGPSQQMDQDPEERHIPSPVVPISTLTPEQEASVMSALEDAMVDCPVQPKPNAQSRQGASGRPTKVYFQYDTAGRDEGDEFSNAMHLTLEESYYESDSSPDEGRMHDASDHLSENFNSLDGFEIVDDNFKDALKIKGSHEVQKLSVDDMDIKDKYVRKPTSSYDHLRAPPGFPDPEHQYTLREMSIVWRLFGGSDFTQARRDSAADQIGLAKVISSPLSPRKQLSGAGKDGKKNIRHKGGRNRDMNSLMELDLSKVRFRYEVYPTNTAQSSRFKFLVHNVEIRDRMKDSEINKFLVKLVDKEHPEQASVYMLMFSGVFTRPQHLTFREECQVKAFILPIKLNVDQGSLNFLRKFISFVSSGDTDPSSGGSGAGDRSSPMTVHSNPNPSPRPSVSSTEPIMRITETHTKEQSMDETELLMKFDDFSMQQSTYLQARLNESDDLDVPQENLPVFIKSFVLICDVTIKLDYRGKQCDMDQGVMGMMLGVASLTGSVITLKRINCQKGILGWNKLLMFIANEWLADIRHRQIHSILKGVGSFNIVFQIVQGITDLVRLPIEQYQKDRRIIRGIQRGTNSFTFNTLMALFELTHKIVGSIQYCAELGYDMMSPGPSVRRRKQLQQRYQQPRNTMEGAKTALQLVTDGAKDSVSNLAAIVSEEGAHKGTVGMVGATLRNAPQECLIKPIAIIAEAGTNIVKGMRNQMDPNKMKEEEDTWKQA